MTRTDTTETMGEMLTPAEVAAMLGVSTQALHNWRTSGKGPPWYGYAGAERTVARYARADVEAFKERCRRPGE